MIQSHPCAKAPHLADILTRVIDLRRHILPTLRRLCRGPLELPALQSQNTPINCCEILPAKHWHANCL